MISSSSIMALSALTLATRDCICRTALDARDCSMCMPIQIPPAMAMPQPIMAMSNGIMNNSFGVLEILIQKMFFALPKKFQ